MTTHEHMRVHQDATHGAWAVGQGIAGGLVAGVVFAVAQVLYTWAVTGDPLMILRMIAGVPLAEVPANISATEAIIAGGITHLLFSMLIGVIVAALIAAVPALNATRGSIVAFATGMGIVVWALTFYVIAPALGATWFAEDTGWFAQLIIHAVALGTVLGFYLDANPPKDLEQQRY